MKTRPTLAVLSLIMLSGAGLLEGRAFAGAAVGVVRENATPEANVRVWLPAVSRDTTDAEPTATPTLVLAGTPTVTTYSTPAPAWTVTATPTTQLTFTTTSTPTSMSTVTPTSIPTSTLTPTPQLCTTPEITFTHVPTYGSFDDLRGRAECIAPADYRIAVYIYVSGWWTKPTWAMSTTIIGVNGDWVTDITTGGSDQFATRIAAFLIPKGYTPPAMSGGQVLPIELFANSLAHLIVERVPERTIRFSGYMWRVKSSVFPVGPGPNIFSDSTENVWVDEQGRLHLRIVARDGRWLCAEVVSTNSFGHGTYVFTLASPVHQLDENVVLGLFTWDDVAPQHHYREVDIEFSRWGEVGGTNAQYVVQPWTTQGNRHRFNIPAEEAVSTHRFTWLPTAAHFFSSRGRLYPHVPADELHAWSYTSADVPPAGGENTRMNLWLLDGRAPVNNQSVEIIVESFRFQP